MTHRSPRRHSAPPGSSKLRSSTQNNFSGSIPSRFEPSVPVLNNQEGFSSSVPRFTSSQTPVPGPGTYSTGTLSNPSISSLGYGYGLVSNVSEMNAWLHSFITYSVNAPSMLNQHFHLSPRKSDFMIHTRRISIHQDLATIISQIHFRDRDPFDPLPSLKP